jgi:hypothetical protein
MKRDDFHRGFLAGVFVAGLIFIAVLALAPKHGRAAVLPIYDARDTTAETVIVCCASPMQRIFAAEAAALVCMPVACPRIFRNGFEGE